MAGAPSACFWLAGPGTYVHNSFMLFSTSASRTVYDPASDPLTTSVSRSHAHDDDQLRFDVERLYMITEALWTLLREKHGYDEDELVKQISLIDLRDGKLDGKTAPAQPRPCPKCNRALGHNRQRCIFCGELVETSPFEH